MVEIYAENIENQTLENNYFRKVIFTGKYTQLVLMNLEPGEEIGNEIHDNVDQFFRIEQGEADFIINNGEQKYTAKEDDAVIIPAGTFHNIICVSDVPLKLYTLYSPPNHLDKTIHKTKAEADEAEEHEHH